MPVYTYECTTCGGFEARRSLAEFAEPAPCPSCDQPSPRALTVPHMAGMDGALLQAHATNERSANAPRASHGATCGCCGPKRSSSNPFRASPSSRPWMISH